jgi:hypothetical protein
MLSHLDVNKEPTFPNSEPAHGRRKFDSVGGKNLVCKFKDFFRSDTMVKNLGGANSRLITSSGSFGSKLSCLFSTNLRVDSGYPCQFTACDHDSDMLQTWCSHLPWEL